jgi:Domain of unknown function (DUF4136)
MPDRAWALIAAVAIAGGLSCATAVKTDVGWNTKADFSRYKTWAWKDDGSIRDPTWNRRVQAVFEDELAKHGLTRSDKDASLWLAVHWRLSSETRVDSYSPAWGYGWGPYWSAPSMTTVYEVPAGAMVVDLVDAERKQILWRANASAEIRANKENAEREDRLREIVAKLFAGYPPHPS